MGDRGRAQARSRGRAKAKVTAPGAPILAPQVAASSASRHETIRSAPQQETIRSAPRHETIRSAPQQETIRSAPQQETIRSAPQHETIRSAPAPHFQSSGRATVRPPAPGPSKRQDAGDAMAPVQSRMESLGIRDEPSQMGRGAMRGKREIAPALRTRPASATVKTGSYGETVSLKCNYFPILAHTDWCLYQYRVDFDPDEERTGIRKKLLALHKEKFGGYLFDGSTMWTTCLLKDPMEMFSKRESDDQNIRIMIKKTVDLCVGDPAYIQLFNIITRKCLEFLDLQLVGRNYFSPKNKFVLKDYNLELWPGYATSIRQHENSILMNVELTHKVMRLESLLDILQECRNRSGQGYRDLYFNTVVGTTVMTVYNQKTYRVDDIRFDMSPRDTFEQKRGDKISYIDYFKTKYNVAIRCMDQPMLISRTNERERRSGMAELISLVPELCTATGITDEMRAQVHLMRALADHTRIAPNVRCDKLRQFLRNLKQSDKAVQECQMWNLKFGDDLLDIKGRILPAEGIVYGNQVKIPCDAVKADWTGALRNQRMLTSWDLKDWVLIVPKKMLRDAQSFSHTLTKAASSLHFHIPPPKILDIFDDRMGSYIEAIDKACQYAPQLLMCIVPNNRGDRYAAIKKKTIVDRRIPSQVVLAKNISSQCRGILSIATKIAIQMNCKLGGAAWAVDIPINGIMVVGFDATHDTSNKSKSYGATVCSLNKSMSHYYSAVTPHSSGEELSNQIAVHITNGCIKYKQVNNELPSRIIIYRDGVGEGQLHHVFNHEVQKIREELKTVYPNEGPKISFVVVSKRINTRIFLRGDNPPPGTIVDDYITSPDRYDFFIVSQSVKQGTVSPTSYNVIYDTSGLPPDRMQRFTYKLTHLYYNWSGTVRVPAPCQYAHKLAMLVGQALHTRPNADLSDKLFYL